MLVNASGTCGATPGLWVIGVQNRLLDYFTKNSVIMMKVSE